MEKDFSKTENIVAHLGDDYTKFLGAVVPPIFQTSLFTRKEASMGYVYTRVNNPTTEVAEKKIAELEKGHKAYCFSSGMAAITASLMNTLSAGDHVVCVSSVYLPVRVFMEHTLSRYGIFCDFVEGTRSEDFEAAVKPNTKLFYLESPSSNIFLMQDIAAVSEVAHARGIRVIIDNTWATPCFQNPLALGADVVVHSASKYLGGHSDIVGGVLITKDPALEAVGAEERSMYGACMDPHQSWLLTRSLRTLPLRMEQHQKNGLKVAKFLESHPKVSKVLYPGLESNPQYALGKKQMSGYSGLMGFTLKTKDPSRIIPALKHLKYFEEGPSWGGFESLFNGSSIGSDAAMKQKFGWPDNLVRVSIGLENGDSIIEDLDNALSLLK